MRSVKHCSVNLTFTLSRSACIISSCLYSAIFILFFTFACFVQLLVIVTHIPWLRDWYSLYSILWVWTCYSLYVISNWNNWELLHWAHCFFDNLICQCISWSVSAYLSVRNRIKLLLEFGILVNEWCIDGLLPMPFTGRDSLYYWQWYSKLLGHINIMTVMTNMLRTGSHFWRMLHPSMLLNKDTGMGQKNDSCIRVSDKVNKDWNYFTDNNFLIKVAFGFLNHLS